LIISVSLPPGFFPLFMVRLLHTSTTSRRPLYHQPMKTLSHGLSSIFSRSEPKGKRPSFRPPLPLTPNKQFLKATRDCCCFSPPSEPSPLRTVSGRLPPPPSPTQRGGFQCFDLQDSRRISGPYQRKTSLRATFFLLELIVSIWR